MKNENSVTCFLAVGQATITCKWIYKKFPGINGEVE
jgi:hypothetical protein